MLPDFRQIGSREALRAHLDAGLTVQARIWPTTILVTAEPTPPPIQSFVAGAVNDVLDAHLDLMNTLSAPIPRLAQLMVLTGAAKVLDRMLDDPILTGLDGLTPRNIAFCRALVTSPSRQATFFELPWTLQAKVQALLDRWDDLTAGERHEAIRAGACAVALLILTRCAPLRIGNLAAIPYKDEGRWLSAPTDGQKALLLIPARHVKNRKQIRAHLNNAGRRDSWALVTWYLAHIRPRMIDGSLNHLKATDSPALFPGKTGSLIPSTLRDWIMTETAAAGFPMRPHQARHAIASILLNRHPDKIVLIAALLGDTVATVQRTYAWLDREKLVADAQDLIPSAATILREARHG